MALPQTFRLRKHADYQRVYKAGRKQFGKNLAYFTMRREAGSDAALHSATEGPRVGLTVPKALGKAHDRNRIKRRMREAVRAHLALLSGPVDVVLHPRRSVLTLEFTALLKEVATVLRSAQASAERPPRVAAPRPAITAAVHPQAVEATP